MRHSPTSRACRRLRSVHDRSLIARAIADAFVAGEWEPLAMSSRAVCALSASAPGSWLVRLATRIRARLSEPPVRIAVLTAAIQRDLGFQRSLTKLTLRVVAPSTTPARMRLPIRASLAVGQPSLDTLFDLASWLCLTPGELDWFAGVHGGERRAGPSALRHYRFHTALKPSGRARLLEAPRPRLRELQRQILREILDRVPVSPHAHGFARGRSALTCAQAHANQAIVLRLDLADFFNSIPGGRVFAIFSALGYPEAVARALTGLSTLTTPPDILDGLPRSGDPGALAERRRQVVMLRQRHLPQGAPTSPALANLVAFRLDRRLGGLAAAVDANYTRYADDLFFSGDDRLARTADRFLRSAATIVREEGFTLRPSKTLIMRASAQQRVTGLVVNRNPNVARRTFDELKAVLHNAIRTGATAQNRAGHPDFQAHLRGRIAWIEQVAPARGARLLALYQKIDWSSAEPELCG